jgi:hypothetical protein
VFETNPFVARLARTTWYGIVLNWDAKIPVHVEVESLVIPPMVNVAVDAVAVRFCRLNGDPGTVHVCPAAGGAEHKAGLLIPNGKLFSLSIVVTALLKLMKFTAGKFGGVSGGFIRGAMFPASLPEIEVGMSPLGNPKGEISILPFWAGVPVSWKKMHEMPTGQLPAGVFTPPDPVTQIVPAMLNVP